MTRSGVRRSLEVPRLVTGGGGVVLGFLRVVHNHKKNCVLFRAIFTYGAFMVLIKTNESPNIFFNFLFPKIIEIILPNYYVKSRGGLRKYCGCPPRGGGFKFLIRVT